MLQQQNEAIQDEAWSHVFDQRPTNYKLRKGMSVRLRAQTLGPGGERVPAGAQGTVVDPRRVRSRRPPGVSSHYLAIIDVTVDGVVVRVSVPHGAVRIRRVETS